MFNENSVSFLANLYHECNKNTMIEIETINNIYKYN
jgi:hypothetical protein